MTVDRDDTARGTAGGAAGRRAAGGLAGRAEGGAEGGAEGTAPRAAGGITQGPAAQGGARDIADLAHGAADGAGYSAARDTAEGAVPVARVLRRTGFTIAADGSYAACLAEASVLSEEGDGGVGLVRRAVDAGRARAVRRAAARRPARGARHRGAAAARRPGAHPAPRRRAPRPRAPLPLGCRHGRGTAGLADRRRGPAAAARAAGRFRPEPSRDGGTTAVWQVHGAGDDPYASRRCPGGVRAGSGSTATDGCWRWTASWTGGPRRSPSTCTRAG